MQLRDGLDLSSVAALYIAEVYGADCFVDELKTMEHNEDLSRVLGYWKLVRLSVSHRLLVPIYRLFVPISHLPTGQY